MGDRISNSVVLGFAMETWYLCFFWTYALDTSCVTFRSQAHDFTVKWIFHYFALTNGIFALKAPKRKHWNWSGLSKWTALATAVTPFFNISARGFHSSHCAATHRSSILIAIGFTLEFNFRWKLCRCYFVRVSLQHIPAQPPQCKTSYQERWHITTPPQPKTFKMDTLSQGAVSTAWQKIQVHSIFIGILSLRLIL